MRAPHRTATLLTSIASLILTGPAVAQGFLVAPPAPPENPVTAEKAVLGKILFWDEQLSSDGSIACGTCHIPAVGGSEPRTAVNPGPDGVYGSPDDSFGSPGVVGGNAFGHFEPRGAFGLEKQVTGRYAPTPIGAAYFSSLFWDGRAGKKFNDPVSGLAVIPNGGALETQSLGPLISDVEMADTGRGFDELTSRVERIRPLALASNLPADVVAALAVDASYPELFQRAFGSPEVTPVRIAFALATYQRTLVPDQTPFDDYERGIPGALTAAQERGFIAFNGSVGCAVCHTPPLFANDDFHNVGLRPTSEDPGRQAVTGNASDAGKFKTPTLRNVALRNHWFHNGEPSITTLRGTVELYGTGVGGGFDNLDPVLSGLSFTAQEIDDVTAFMEALTDPRVAAETFPFDRPTLRSERGTPNPVLLGGGEVAGSAGLAPEVILSPAPFVGADDFRIGIDGALGGTIASLRLRLVDLGGFAGSGGALALRRFPVPSAPVILAGHGLDGGYGTWSFPLTGSPALRGVTFDAQWWVRDAGAAGGIAKSEELRFVVE